MIMMTGGKLFHTYGGLHLVIPNFYLTLKKQCVHIRRALGWNHPVRLAPVRIFEFEISGNHSQYEGHEACVSASAFGIGRIDFTRSTHHTTSMFASFAFGEATSQGGGGGGGETATATATASMALDAAKEGGDVTSAGRKRSSEELSEKTSPDASIEIIEDRRSDRPSEVALERNDSISLSKRVSRPRRAAKANNLSAAYTVDEEPIDLEEWDESEDEEGDENPDPKRYIESSSDEEGPAEEEVQIIQEAKQGLKNIEIILWQRRSPTQEGVKEMRVKFVGTSYRKTQWVDRENLVAAGKQAAVRGYDKRFAQGKVDPYNDMEDGVRPEWCVVERVLAERACHDGATQYLVKWCDLGYSESTWESTEDLKSLEDLEAIEMYNARRGAEAEKVARHGEEYAFPALDLSAVPAFCNGRELRDYQKHSLKWMSNNWYNGKNCILGDEMGLGKTAQSIASIEFQRQFGKVVHPFLIIAPLTTLGHWKREIETWTDMNCVLYCGTAKDKAVIKEYDMYCAGTDVIKPDVVLSSFEHVMKDAEFFQGIMWETMIIDEAHRMKGMKSATRTCVADISCSWILLLTGTPVQNNIKELFGILNLLDSETFSDEDAFLDRFGRTADKMTPEQVVDLQMQLKPLLLRRMKEDVETLPEKEECVIWVELTKEQRAYYKAIFANQIGTLLGGGSTENAPLLRNVAMELRKVCNHPFLCDGVEEDYGKRMKDAAASAESPAPLSELDLLVSACGKMQLLHKLLPKLREEKRKVLIFSQFKMMLDVLEDYAHIMEYPVERIDGSTASKERQAAIDRFSSDEKDGFIFLLSTKAGGQGITLTAADTCILYDSDWNPQNDLQAMARCHRIGQSKDVTIYRLVSKNTYEENLFRTSSKKYGLDEAILGGLGSLGVASDGGGNPEYDGAKIAALLKHGAHCLKDEDRANEEANAFLSEDIEQILKGRTEKRQIGGRAGNTFSVATFGEQAVSPAKEGKNGNDQDFWKALLPDAVASHEKKEKLAKQPDVLPPRRRTTVDYSEKRRWAKRRSSEEDYDLEADDGALDLLGAVNGVTRKKSKAKSKKSKEPPPPYVKKWAITNLNQVLDGLLRFGMNLDRFEASTTVMESFTSKRFEAPHVMGVARFVIGVWGSIAPLSLGKPPSTTYSHPEGTPEDVLQKKDEEIRQKLAEYDAAVAELVSNMVSSLPTRLADLRKIGVPEDCTECFADPKFYTRIIEWGGQMKDQIDALEGIRLRVVEKNVRLPTVVLKATPPFWNSGAVFNNDDLNDRYVLKRIWELGWEFSGRRSKDQDDTIISILETDDFFGKMREEYLGTQTAPPTNSSFVTEDQWRESPAFGYKNLSTIVYNRVRLYMKEFSKLESLRRMTMAASGLPARSEVNAKPTALHALDENRPPANTFKHGTKQMDLFQAFKGGRTVVDDEEKNGRDQTRELEVDLT